MRTTFCQALVALAERPDFVFMTGDLGYLALEPLRDAMGNRFMNAGVAEQNMIGVAAGLARTGLRPWAYSIASFLFARPFEQIRNDVCFHHLPVVLVGNGGGYGYGVMGATHHAIEDYGTLLGLPHMRAYVPAFDADVVAMAAELFNIDHPAYLRLGVAEPPPGAVIPAYAPWRKLCDGSAGVVVAIGPLVGGIWGAIRELPREQRPALWLVSELPLVDLPREFLAEIQTKRLVTVEEHVAQSGLGRMLAQRLLEEGCPPASFHVCSAQGYPSGRYGSQKYHRHESGLDPVAVLQQVRGGA